MDKQKVAGRLLVLARELAAEDDEGLEELDENFVMKLRGLRSGLKNLAQKKRKKLGAFGIGTLRQNNTVEDLVEALYRVMLS